MRGLSTSSVSLLILVLLLVGCGTEGTELALAVESGPRTLMLNGTLDLRVSVRRVGSGSDTITMEVEGLPAGVTAHFTPAALTRSENSTTLTLTSARTAETGKFPVALSATGPEVNRARTTVDLWVEGLSLSGRVEVQPGLPVSGLVVRVDGSPATSTDLNGSFELSGVAAPYDLTVVRPGAWAHVFRGLSTATPSVILLTGLAESNVDHRAVLRGTVAGPGSANGSSRRLQVCIEGVEDIVHGCATIPPGENGYLLQASWAGDARTRIRLHALQSSIDEATGATAIEGYKAMELDLIAGTSATADLVLAPRLFAGTTDYRIDVPDGVADRPTVFGGVRLGEHLSFASGGQTVDGAARVRVPDWWDRTPTLMGIATGEAGMATAWMIGRGQRGDAILRLPRPPAPVTPLEGASDVTLDTEFRVDNPAGGTLTFSFRHRESGARILVSTLESGSHIPDLRSVGLPLAPASDYQWSVFATPSVVTADDMVSGDGVFGGYNQFVEASSDRGSGPVRDGSLSGSASRAFSTR